MTISEAKQKMIEAHQKLERAENAGLSRALLVRLYRKFKRATRQYDKALKEGSKQNVKCDTRA